MKRRSLNCMILAVLFSCLLLAAGCTMNPSAQSGQENKNLSPSITPSPAGSSAASVPDANNRFSASLYRELAAGDATSNILFSPFSISSALAITYEGARGTT
ncbi:MAG: serpin family protein, partial [Methanoregula sp.]|nr:serpin family protein [Methanoregula sp.]